MTRPRLGQQVKARDRLERRISHSTGVKEWLHPQGEEKPVEGIYVGCRTYQKGRTLWESDVYEWEQMGQIKVWLIVENEHRNPVPVLPHDCEEVSDE